METRAPFDFEIIGWHLRGWINIDINPDRYECKVTEITINQIDRMTLPHYTYLSMETLPEEDRKRVQEYADQWVDDNWHDICREYAESIKSDRWNDGY